MDGLPQLKHELKITMCPFLTAQSLDGEVSLCFLSFFLFCFSSNTCNCKIKKEEKKAVPFCPIGGIPAQTPTSTQTNGSVRFHSCPLSNLPLLCDITCFLGHVTLLYIDCGHFGLRIQCPFVYTTRCSTLKGHTRQPEAND